MARPNELTLGLLTLLAGFGQGYSQGKISKQEQEREEKEKRGLRRERELTREETRRARMSEEGERVLERAQRKEEFALTKGLQERGIAVQEEANVLRGLDIAGERERGVRELNLKEIGLDLERDTLEARTRIERLMLQVEQAKMKAANAGHPTTEQDYVLGSLAELNKDPITAIGLFKDTDKLGAYLTGLRTSFKMATGVKASTEDSGEGTGEVVGPLPGVYSPILGREVPSTEQLMRPRIAAPTANPYKEIIADLISRRTAAPLDSILSEALSIQRNRPRRNSAYANPTKTVK